MQKICLSTSINTWFSIRSLDWPRQEQLCSWPVLSACLRYDVTTTNLWCMIMNEFPVCVFACRAVDCFNLFILSEFMFKLPRPGLELGFWKAVLKSTQILSLRLLCWIWSSNLNTDPADMNYSECVSTPHKVMNGRGFKGLLVEWLYIQKASWNPPACTVALGWSDWPTNAA